MTFCRGGCVSLAVAFLWRCCGRAAADRRNAPVAVHWHLQPSQQPPIVFNNERDGSRPPPLWHWYAGGPTGIGARLFSSSTLLLPSHGDRSPRLPLHCPQLHALQTLFSITSPKATRRSTSIESCLGLTTRRPSRLLSYLGLSTGVNRGVPCYKAAAARVSTPALRKMTDMRSRGASPSFTI
ncbi:uncharacterized protein EI97DRAFT_308910 [Westerdykella ornata]|uniref:Secreted protein n=1 Tax=Westerdykella ornata TaxID=318751 RepID=A0A6A6JKA9_WESOR|nr:uncharacterized protein EI97DRAFT_308910 [Westerdykella ornata]KAF2277090.1 hypothetical protein EI97DRAFT_308910 [Westerdykella ornata]